ncbi:MAG: hypothetical protein ABIP54_01700 [Candidatus Andersenbacteria bacterium]
MTASTIIDGQIDDVVAKLRDALRKHRPEISFEAAQQVLGWEDLGMMLLEPFRQQVEMMSSLIVRRVKVDRTRSGRQVIYDPEGVQYVNQEIVDSMPCGEGDEVDSVFFKPLKWECTRSGYVSHDDLRKAYDRRNIIPDVYAVAKANEDNRVFTDNHPNIVYWKNTNGIWNFISFRRWRGRRRVTVRRHEGGWDDDWWFGGSRKISVER